jgi:hypothetical protein
MFIGYTIDEHVRLWCDDSRIDETQEEETANKRADGEISSLRVLSLGQ